MYVAAGALAGQKTQPRQIPNYRSVLSDPFVNPASAPVWRSEPIHTLRELNFSYTIQTQKFS